MRAVIQRVVEASVDIEGRTVGAIARGLLVLLGICEEDCPADADYLADKCAGLRIFTDENDKMNLGLADVQGSMLVVSQFTLYGDCKKGKRPSFLRAARPDVAIPLYERFISRLREGGTPVTTGTFGADMQVRLVNDGPVTLILDTAEMLPRGGN